MISTEQKLPRSFAWYNVAQFGGALNDNLFRLLLILFLVAVQGEAAVSRVSALAGGVFVLPFLLFTPFAGVLADRFSKRDITIGVKCAECLAMVLAIVAFGLNNVLFAYTVLFLMSTQSAIFGPSKYGIVPELVGEHRLSRANSLVVLLTYVAIIVGSATAPTLDQMLGSNYMLTAAICLAIALAGLAAAFQVPATPQMDQQHKVGPTFVRAIFRTLASIRHDGLLTLSVYAAAFFLFLGGFVQMNILPYGMEIFDLTRQGSAYLFLPAAFGIGLGAWAVGRWSAGRVELGWVPAGVIIVVLASLALGLMVTNLIVSIGLFFVLGFGAGLFIVPLEAYIQYRSPSKRRGEIIASKAFLAWLGVLLASALIFLFSDALNWDPTRGFLFISIVTTLLLGVALYELPDFRRAFLVTIGTRLLFKPRCVGWQHIPDDGPALFIVNRISWLDMLALQTMLQRRIVFPLPRAVFEKKGHQTLIKRLGGIPLPQDDDDSTAAADFIKRLRNSLADGESVCLFAEDTLSRAEWKDTFRKGFSGLTRDSKAPVVPVYYGGIHGSIQGYQHGKTGLSKWLQPPYPVTALIAPAVPPDTPAAEVLQIIREQSVAYFDQIKATRRSLGEEFVLSARRNWSHHAIADTTGKFLNFGRLLTGAIALQSVIRADTRDQKYIGILLPSSVGGVFANLAVTLMGKVAVNLSYVGSNDFRAQCIKECDIQTVLTSRKLIDKLDTLEAPPGAVYLEDLLPRVTTLRKLVSLIRARFAPRCCITPVGKILPDTPATIMFSSGSTGVPKGIILSHHNILSNVEAFRMVYQPTPKDNIGAALPFFHSFGYTTTLWFPALSGFGASYHTSPLEGEQIARMVEKNQCTLLLATPTFLLNYMRKASPDQFKSLQHVVVGAEKLKPAIIQAFHEKFGIRPLEGYGATECSPVISVNLPPVEIDGEKHDSAREGSVGRPLPGMAVKIQHPETGDSLSPGQEGLLLVRGPNVMQGYLNQPEKTAEVLQDGWYVTGDIVHLDAEGYITIKDRWARFSKIGGEMVPHIAIEDVLHQALNSMEPVLTVTSAPHPKRGEQLIVLYTEAAGDAGKLRQIIKDSDLPNLWKPDRNAYHKVDALPLLGSGKLDMAALRTLAKSLVE